MKSTVTTNRRGLLVRLALAFLAIPNAIAGVRAKKPEAKHVRVQWKKLTEEKIRIGDFWASHDPNTPERQGGGPTGNEPIYFCYNLQMQAVHPSTLGKSANKIGCGNGAYWRPISLIEVS